MRLILTMPITHFTSQDGISMRHQTPSLLTSFWYKRVTQKVQWTGNKSRKFGWSVKRALFIHQPSIITSQRGSQMMHLHIRIQWARSDQRRSPGHTIHMIMICKVSIVELGNCYSLFVLGTLLSNSYKCKIIFELKKLIENCYLFFIPKINSDI